MFLLPERNVPIPLSRDEVCKMGDWGGAAVRPAPTIAWEVPWRGQPERGGGRNADSHTHSSWVLLRDAEEEGVTCLQQEIKLKDCCPSCCTSSRQPKNEPRGPTGKVILFTRWKEKPQQLFSF